LAKRTRALRAQSASVLHRHRARRPAFLQGLGVNGWKNDRREAVDEFSLFDLVIVQRLVGDLVSIQKPARPSFVAGGHA
jgi:hypothetical protein